MKSHLTEADALHFAHVYNFIGELKLRRSSLKAEIYMTSRRQGALDALADQLDIPLVLLDGRMTMRLRHQPDLHRLIGRAWPYLTPDRQYEFNSTMNALQELMNDRARRRSERLREQSLAAKRQPLSDEQRMAQAEALYDNSDPAVQVIDSMSPADLIEAELAKMAAYRHAELVKREKEMTQGQVPLTSITRNAPTKRRRRRKK